MSVQLVAAMPVGLSKTQGIQCGGSPQLDIIGLPFSQGLTIFQVTIPPFEVLKETFL